MSDVIRCPPPKLEETCPISKSLRAIDPRAGSRERRQSHPLFSVLQDRLCSRDPCKSSSTHIHSRESRAPRDLDGPLPKQEPAATHSVEDVPPVRRAESCYISRPDSDAWEASGKATTAERKDDPTKLHGGQLPGIRHPR